MSGEDLSRLTVANLRARLDELGVAHKALKRKADLVAKLEEVLASQDGESGANADTADDSNAANGDAADAMETDVVVTPSTEAARHQPSTDVIAKETESSSALNGHTASESDSGVKQEKMSKAARRRAKKKAEKRAAKGAQSGDSGTENNNPQSGARSESARQTAVSKTSDEDQTKAKEAPAVEYVPEQLDLDDPRFAMFKEVMSAFDARGKPKEEEEETKKESKDDEEKSDDDDEDKVISKKKLKKMNRLSVAELKQLVQRPDVVEVHDCNSSDPKLLISLKAYPNTVAVPKHWSAKGKYLQRKRGFEKPSFQLPQFIADTGIAKVRDEEAATDDGKSAKQKGRERMNPKMGRIDIDYQVLHDAFFRYQTKPDMTKHGQQYYEGAEFELKLKEKKPGHYSEELMAAVGMNHPAAPPPWIFNMQRYGPPPSYPMLQIPGVNCPIPPGARYGFNAGEWGKPPVDAAGRSIWGGDVFGTPESAAALAAQEQEDAMIDRTRWGQIEEEESEEEEEEEEEAAPEPDADGDMDMGQDAVAGTQSVASAIGGSTTPDVVQLRKQKDGTGTETPTTQRPLYQVLEQKDVSVEKNALFGTSHTYVLPQGVSSQHAPPVAGSTDAERKARDRKAAIKQQVDVALDASELETLDAEALKRKYEERLESEKAARATMRVDAQDVLDEEREKKKRKMEKKFKF